MYDSGMVTDKNDPDISHWKPYAQGEVEVSVLFAPEREGACAATAWCQMEGRTARVPLTLQGQGLGPLVG